jgi:DNA-binding protein H-NS
VDAHVTKQQLRDLAEKRGFNIDKLFGKRGGKRSSAAAKFRNPKDSAQIWTGRGRKPNWLVDAVKKGGEMTDSPSDGKGSLLGQPVRSFIILK